MMVNSKGFRNLRILTVKLAAHMDVKDILKDGEIWAREGL